MLIFERFENGFSCGAELFLDPRVRLTVVTNILSKRLSQIIALLDSVLILKEHNQPHFVAKLGLDCFSDEQSTNLLS